MLTTRRIVVFLVATILLSFGYLISTRRYDVQDTLTYATRPAWDKPDGPQTVLPHFGWTSGDERATCARHGWSARNGTRPQLWDATLINTELDMLEIRLRELWDHVDRFVILESTYTMTGQPKNLSFPSQKERFRQWASKIEYTFIEGRPMKRGDGAFTLANEMRQAMKDYINSLSPPQDLLVLMADVDEIPASTTLSLIRACQVPLPLHLQLQNYLYSFEWATDARSWRAQIHSWSRANDTATTPPGPGYTHAQNSNVMLAASGWHCSYCFRTLSEFRTKMLSASHVERLLHRPNRASLTLSSTIQSKICRGEDLYGMLPEAYSWTELIGLWKGARWNADLTKLPKALMEDGESRWKWLLPGGCQREEGES